MSQCHIPQHNMAQEQRGMGFGRRLPEIHRIKLCSLPNAIEFYQRRACLCQLLLGGHDFKKVDRWMPAEAAAQGQARKCKQAQDEWGISRAGGIKLCSLPNAIEFYQRRACLCQLLLGGHAFKLIQRVMTTEAQAAGQDYLKPFRQDAEVQVDGPEAEVVARHRLAEGRLRQDLEAALELNQQLEEVLREKTRASEEAEAKDLRRVAEISEAEREKHQKLEKDFEAADTREAEWKHQHFQLEKALQDAEIRAQKEHRSWHRERQRCETLQEELCEAQRELKISTTEAAEAMAKAKKLESTMATNEVSCNDLRETVEIFRSECAQELAARKKTAKDLQLSQEKLQALSVLTDQLRSEVQEARRSLKGSPAASPAPAEPVTVCYEPIAVTEQALRIQATENWMN
eukprot:s1185_g6.t1